MEKLRKIKRKELDVEKYSKALNDSLNYRIYAEYWYLDILTDEKWECWIYGDYEVIMPIPLQYKFGFKFVLQPDYCQQLGVFYKNEISENLFKEFEKKLHKYRVRSYCFNEENTERYNPVGEKRVNYILDLNRPYEEILKQFSKSTKWNLKQFQKSGLNVTSSKDIEQIILLKKSTANYKLSYNLEDLLNTFQKNSCLQNMVVLNEDNSLIGYAGFILSKNRIFYIDAGATNEGKRLNVPTGILWEIIKTNSSQDLLLDFEGSTIPQIEFFFKGFKGKKTFFCCFSNFHFSLKQRIWN